MKYFINPNAFMSAFSLPSSISDNYLKIASGTEIKVIIYFFRHSSDGFNIEKCSEDLGISTGEIEDSLLFWCDQGVILKQGETLENETQKPKAVVKNAKPTRQDVARRGLEDKNVTLILSEAQLKFGRNLKTNESSTLLYIYDDLGLDISVVLFLLQYAFNEGKLNIRFIEKTAVEWSNKGVNSVLDAEKIITEKIKSDLAWKRTEKAFGIEHRKPSAKETKYSNLWFNDWELNDEVLSIAYDTCVDAKSKFIFEYCAKIIENWHKEGLITPEDIRFYVENHKPEKPNKTDISYAGYDIELYEKMINSDD